MLSVVMPNGTMCNVVMLDVIMINVVVLSIVMLSITSLFFTICGILLKYRYTKCRAAVEMTSPVLNNGKRIIFKLDIDGTD